MDYDKRLNRNSPYEIPAKGWKKILLRVKGQIPEDNLVIVAAGVSFYTFLAIFPALIAVISIYGLVIDPEQIAEQVERIANVVPQEAASIIEGRLTKLTETSSSALSWGTVLSILLALWSTNVGIKALFKGINIAYDEKENRGFLKLNLVTLGFTLGTIIIAIISLVFVVGFPAFADNLGFGETVVTIVGWLRWLVLAAIVCGWISLIYKYAPAQKHPTFKWVSVGAIFATVLWVLASLGFSFYVSNFADYNAMYGSIAAVVILMFWLFLTNFIVLLGAEINSEAEQQI